MDSVVFTIGGNALSKNQAYRRGRGKRLYLTEIARNWKKTVSIQALMNKPQTWRMEGEKDVQLVFYFSNKRHDTGNPMDLMLDAMQKMLYYNDRQVRDIILRKRLDRDSPRTEITVWQVA
jgi:Holliday junction resolvase RusA-like endonuclease